MMNINAIMKRAISMFVCCAISAYALASSSESGTLTIESGLICRGIGVNVAFGAGFDNGTYGTYGSYSPLGLTGGQDVKGVFDIVSNDTCSSLTTHAELVVSGFSSNPGSSWLVSVTCNDVERASGSVFNYSGGVATWQWVRTFGFYNQSVGSQVACTIVHN